MMQVAAHVPYMTVDTVTPGSQKYWGTFNTQTTPNLDQALLLIAQAWPPVAAAAGGLVESVWPLAQQVAALRAAAAIVRAYPRDNGDLARAAALDARADADLKRLIDANEAAGGGQGSDPADALMPLYSFPPAPAWGDWLL
ncbi:hypothetical protein ABZ949_02330 [Micromonospora tulbaghiae]|uniref:hypothetical protein n=1 Tax=Micromonospora tulbaghiae TaxID=479978 RepID=UPI0033FDA291